MCLGGSLFYAAGHQSAFENLKEHSGGFLRQIGKIRIDSGLWNLERRMRNEDKNIPVRDLDPDDDHFRHIPVPGAG